MTLTMGSKIFLGKYRVAAEEIGAVGQPGDQPTTYEGEDIDSGRKVRLELISIAALQIETREQLQSRAIAAKKLNHLNIQPLWDFGIQDDYLVYVRENLEGTLLSDWVKTHGPMPVGAVLRIAAQVVSALGAAGFHKIVHHAINPTNLMLVPGQTADGQWPLVKVLHFERSGSLHGSRDSLSYTSPEQLRYHMVDFGSEVYSLGATMCFLLTGNPPAMNPEGTVALPTESAGAVSDPGNVIPGNIRRLLETMLSVNPSSRPRDPLQFYNQLLNCLTEMGPREATMPRRAPTSSVSSTRTIEPAPAPRIPIKGAVIVGLCLAITSAAFFFLRGYIRPSQSVQTTQPVRPRMSPPNPAPSPTPGSLGEPVVMLATGKSEANQSPVSPAINVMLVSYTPMIGMPGEKDYKIATLTFKIEASSPVQVTDASFYVDSAPFTEGSTQKLPITLLIHTGVFLGPPGTVVDSSHPMERTIWLKSQETSFPNWRLAYDQTENASFRWALGGQRTGGSVIKPLHKAWSSPRPTPEGRPGHQ